MNELLPMITERDGIPVTTSRAVAEQFGKQHKNVIRDIETLISQLKIEPATADFAELNFIRIDQPDTQGKPRPAYLLTRDGFTLLAMGFTGAKAVQFKVAYINAFNRMERLIRGGGVSAPAPALKSIERRLEALEQATGAQTADLSEVGATFLQAIRAAIESGEYYISRPYSKTAETGKQLGSRSSHQPGRERQAYSSNHSAGAGRRARRICSGLADRQRVCRLERERIKKDPLKSDKLRSGFILIWKRVQPPDHSQERRQPLRGYQAGAWLSCSPAGQ